MNKSPIYIVDDDPDDQEILENVWQELGYPNDLVFFHQAEPVILKLREEGSNPFLILCDVNLPKTDGFELKAKILSEAALNVKSIPFIFWSSLASEQQIKKAYDLGAHGFFIKGSTFDDLKKSMLCIMTYWMTSRQPTVN